LVLTTHTPAQSLETSILARRELVAAVGRPLIEAGHITEAFISYTCRGAARHVNRHVREASFTLITAIIEACGTPEGGDSPAAGPGLAAQFVPVLVTGLLVSSTSSCLIQYNAFQVVIVYIFAFQYW
jgi:hypothetical protein